MFLREEKETVENYLFNIPMAVVPMLAGIYVIVQLLRTPKLEVYARKTLWFFAIGIGLWGLGNLIYFYINIVLKNPVPFPSPVDMVYLSASFALICAAYFYNCFLGYGFIIRKALVSCVMFIFLVACMVFGMHMMLGIPFIMQWRDIRTYELAITIPDWIVLFELGVMLISSVFVKQKKNIQLSLQLFFGLGLAYIADLAYVYFASYFYVVSWIDFTYFSAYTLLSLGLLALFDAVFIDKKV